MSDIPEMPAMLPINTGAGPEDTRLSVALTPIPEPSTVTTITAAEDADAAGAIGQETAPAAVEETSEDATSAVDDAEENVQPITTEQESELRSIVEALIFASDEPISNKFIRQIIDDVNKDRVEDNRIRASTDGVKKSVAAINAAYADRAFHIAPIAGGFVFATKAKYSVFVGKLAKEKARRKLSATAIESLAIIAYKQPITKSEVEFIRGVNADYIVKTLLEKNLITITGRASTPGRPLLYGTTDEFLKHFGLNEITDLPKPREIEELIGETELEVEKRMLAEQQELEFKDELSQKLEGGQKPSGSRPPLRQNAPRTIVAGAPGALPVTGVVPSDASLAIVLPETTEAANLQPAEIETAEPAAAIERPDALEAGVDEPVAAGKQSDDETRELTAIADADDDEPVAAGKQSDDETRELTAIADADDDEPVAAGIQSDDETRELTAIADADDDEPVLTETLDVASAPRVPASTDAEDDDAATNAWVLKTIADEQEAADLALAAEAASDDAPIEDAVLTETPDDAPNEDAVLTETLHDEPVHDDRVAEEDDREERAADDAPDAETVLKETAPAEAVAGDAELDVGVATVPDGSNASGAEIMAAAGDHAAAHERGMAEDGDATVSDEREIHTMSAEDGTQSDSNNGGIEPTSEKGWSKWKTKIKTFFKKLFE